MSTPAPDPIFISTKSGPFTLQFQCHPTVESFDFAAGYIGAALEDAHRWHLHRETMPRFAEEFLPLAEKISGIPRRVDAKATKAYRDSLVNKDKATPVLETHGRYFSRLEREASPSILDELRVAALTLSRTFTVNVSPVERKTSIEPMYYKRADSWLEVLSTENLQSRVDKLLPTVPGFRPDINGDERITRESLAKLLQKVDENELQMQD